MRSRTQSPPSTPTASPLRATSLLFVLLLVLSSAASGDTLLLTEIVVTPTGGELIEIHNPTAAAIDLSDVYLTDATYASGGAYYYNIPTGANAGGGSVFDFHARFPAGASIAAGEYQTIALNGSDDFFTEYGINPTYELYEDVGTPDAIPDMREALSGSIAGQGGLSNGGEVVVLYTWDGTTDLVADLDYALWGDKAEAVDKTGVAIDGPDGDAVTTTYLADTAIASQDVIDTDAHLIDMSWQRADLSEGTETPTGGNGAGGHDETSENVGTTWTEATPTPGAAYLPTATRLLLTEFVVTPTAGEFIEIYNPNAGEVNLSDYYLTDATYASGSAYYYNITTGAGAGGGGFGDFHARFPDGATIAAREFQTIALNGSDNFFTEYGVNPTYELYEDAGTPDAIPDMREALSGSIAGQGGLTNGGEVVVLYWWEGTTDLVTDVDYALWGDKAEAVDKTGVAIDGPDGDAVTTSYQNDTAIAGQDIVSAGTHGGGESFRRTDLGEGTETQTGGNGADGSDETSENLSVTWETSTSPSPGEAGGSFDWVINEIHADPDSSLGDANGDGSVNTTGDEFVEIINNSGVAADIGGWTLSDGYGVRHTFPANTVVPADCGVLVFASGTPTGSFGNIEVQVASTGALGLNNSGDTVSLNSGTNDVAFAAYGSEGGDNQSLTLDPDVTGSSFVKHTLATGSGGALFSAGTRIDGTNFSGCLAPVPWVINEIHADPDPTSGDANGDSTVSASDDEFVELVNNTGGYVDISGWTLADGTGVRHTFPAGTLLLDGCNVLVFGGGTPTGSFGGCVVQVASTGALGLDDAGDTVTVNDGASDVGTATYGSEGGDNQSLTLDPDVLGTAYVKHTLATGSGGALYSPGTRIDGGSFVGCPVGTFEIFAIQGSSTATPYDGQTVITLDNVVTAVGPEGFFIQ
ncbi:MAG: hypothetical protein GY856_15895, partial [bacterium]|nr:hypothetical protein [bacterium]